MLYSDDYGTGENKNKPKEVLLWCYLPDSSTQKKRKIPSEQATKRSKSLQSNEKKVCEAKEVLEELRQKHAGKYNHEQLHGWAQLIQMEKHSSLEEPPDFPFFKQKSHKKIHQHCLLQAKDFHQEDAFTCALNALNSFRK